uniref:Uncharacterized protein n=1 Tax=Leptospira ellisii TaxID=2023197 RepID=A0A2N0BE99_9LEPT|nr:hypothetical protein CH379_00740 [Leptospira ellisii]
MQTFINLKLRKKTKEERILNYYVTYNYVLPPPAEIFGKRIQDLGDINQRSIPKIMILFFPT